MRRLLPYISVCVLSIAVFTAGAYWGSYQFGKVFSDLNTQTYMEKSIAHQVSLIGALRHLDSGEITFARSQLKGEEDSLIITVNAYRNFLDKEAFSFACLLLQDIARYREEHHTQYGERPSPIDPDITDILEMWQAIDCDHDNFQEHI